MHPGDESASNRRREPRLRAVLASQLLLLAGLRLVVLQPERCPAPPAVQAAATADAAIGWFERNLRADGRWLYRYQPATDEVVTGYNIVRHAGVLLALEQAAAAGRPEAAEAADGGWPFVEGRLRPVPTLSGALAFAEAGAFADTGATSLAVSAWHLRLQRTPAVADSSPTAGSGAEPHGPALVQALGRFLAAQVEPSGAVAAARDLRDGRAIPTRSRFSTGEATWALQLLARTWPGQGFDAPAAASLRYLVAERDAAERWFPAIADHWASYALAAADGLPHVSAIPSGTVGAYRETLAGRFAIQVRWESQRRPGRWWSDVTRARPASAAAIGTLGEGLGQLARGEPDERRADGLRRQLGCVAGLLVHRQIDERIAAFHPDPSRSMGAWTAGGFTQMDDQQHALSALLAYLDASGEGGSGAGG